jgi:hypothetical protein
MLSILIPIYNFNVVSLIEVLLKQINEVNNTIEIICCDDASTNTKLKKVNDDFFNKHQILHFENLSNFGRTKTRQLLAEKANYDWILFLDADVIPATSSFIRSYLSHCNKDYNCIYGGLCYSKNQPQEKHLFRWLYGHKREDISVAKRQDKPYKSIASGNLLIKKHLFLSINKNILYNWYGFDNFLSTQLKSQNAFIKHIDNKVFHLGLEDNTTFLKKQESATKTIYNLYINNKFSDTNDNGLLNMYSKLKKYKLTRAYLCFYIFSKPLLRNNLLSRSPKIFYLDLYKLGYFCKLTHHENA